MRTLLLLAALTVPATQASAIDLFDFADLRVGVETAGSNAKTTYAGVESKDKWNNAQRYSADWLAGTSFVLFGIAYGVGATQDRRTSDTLEQKNTTAHLQLGPYISLGPVQLELLGMLGRGTSKLTASTSDDSTTVDEQGVSLGANISLLHLVVGARAGLLKQKADYDISGSSLSVENADYTAGLYAGWRF